MDHERCDPAREVDAKKKSVAATERNEEERAAWRQQMNQQEAEGLVFVDECGSHIALTPLYARAPKTFGVNYAKQATSQSNQRKPTEPDAESC